MDQRYKLTEHEFPFFNFCKIDRPKGTRTQDVDHEKRSFGGVADKP